MTASFDSYDTLRGTGYLCDEARDMFVLADGLRWRQTAPPLGCAGNCYDWATRVTRDVTIKSSGSRLRNVNVSMLETTPDSVRFYITGKILVHLISAFWANDFELKTS